ncbi:unnamed protein product [Ilex paraguariensis]|uniref:F-box domain-containing protein n=1 Tax=Ilex paraguariensis TaxID=185542 RepID=A0ABC8TYE9_9AQUA
METESKQKRKGSEEDGKIRLTPMDPISQLSDHLIHKVLSFLETKYAARTSVLSKAWNRIWLTFPIININVHYNHYIQNNHLLESSQEEFLSLVDESLQRRFQENFSVSVFSMLISLPSLELVAPHMDWWLGIALERNVQKMVLIFCTDAHRLYHVRVPHAVMSATSLNVLELQNCTVDGNCNIKLPQLCMLTLRYVRLLDEKMLSDLSFNFPIIEDLVIRSSKGLNSDIDIDVGLAAFIGLKVLKLQDAMITDEKFQNLMSKLPCLEDLELIWCGSLNRIRISSQKRPSETEVGIL